MIAAPKAAEETRKPREGAHICRTTLRTRHTYFFMTASPNRPQEECEEAVSDLDAAIVPKPFDIETQLAAVDDATRRLETPSDTDA